MFRGVSKNALKGPQDVGNLCATGRSGVGATVETSLNLLNLKALFCSDDMVVARILLEYKQAVYTHRVIRRCSERVRDLNDCSHDYGMLARSLLTAECYVLPKS